MSVFFRGPDQIEIDGVSAGGIEDVINYPLSASEFCFAAISTEISQRSI